jgi:excisionase family DNA binding protein
MFAIYFIFLSITTYTYNKILGGNMNTVDIARASEILGISKSSLYNHVKNKKIEHLRIEGRILFDKEILDRYLESRIIKAVSDFESNLQKEKSKLQKKQ